MRRADSCQERRDLADAVSVDVRVSLDVARVGMVERRLPYTSLLVHAARGSRLMAA